MIHDVDNNNSIYFLIFILINIILFLFYRVFESKAREEAIQERLNTVSASRYSNNDIGNIKSLFLNKSKPDSLLERKLNSILSKRSTSDQPLHLFLMRCGITMNPTKILIVWATTWSIILLSLIYIFNLDLLKSLFISFAITSFGFYSLLNRMQASHKKKFLDSLPQAVDIILRGIRSGSSIEKTFVIVARESPSPLKDEFEQILKELDFGIAYDRILVNSASKIDVNEYYFLVTALIIQRQSGGSLSDVLENILYVLNKVEEMQSKIRIVSAEGRLSGIVLAALPIIIGLFMYKFSPDQIMFFYYDPLGNKFFYVIMFLFFCGYISIKRMITIKT